MRLLILDEAWEIVGGVDTFRRSFVPAAAKFTEKIVWACNPEHTRSQLGIAKIEGIEMVDLHPSTSSWRGLARAVLRRLPGIPNRWRDRALTALSHSYLREICRQHCLTHAFEICVHRRLFPDLGLPTTGFVHDLSYPDRGNSPIDAIFRDWLSRAPRLYVNSTQTRAELLQLSPSAADRIEIVLLASSPVQPPIADSPNPWIRPEAVLYYPARATKHKGQNILLAALAKLAAQDIPFHCYLSGHGTNCLFDDSPSPEQSVNDVRLACRKFRDPLRGRVTLLGRQSWEAIEQLYQAANLVVLPTRFEGFGLPLSEALLRGKPVIASRLGPMEEQVAFYAADAQVRWVPPGDESALAASLQEFLSGTAPFPPFAPDLQSRLAHWTWDAIARQIITSLEKR